jgi:hypothetical protein
MLLHNSMPVRAIARFRFNLLTVSYVTSVTKSIITSAMAVSRTLDSIKEQYLSPPGDAPRENTVKRQPPPWSQLHCLIAELSLVTDYGVCLTVRVGILSPLACAPFRVVLPYTVAPLRGGHFHRPFQGFSAPRYVSTTLPNGVSTLCICCTRPSERIASVCDASRQSRQFPACPQVWFSLTILGRHACGLHPILPARETSPIFHPRLICRARTATAWRWKVCGDRASARSWTVLGIPGCWLPKRGRNTVMTAGTKRWSVSSRSSSAPSVAKLWML